MSIDRDLKAFTDSISSFASWSHAEKIRLFVWFQHAVKAKDRLQTADISKCYDDLSYEKPNISQFLAEMERRKPKVLLRDDRGYYLEGTVRAEYDAKYGKRKSTIAVEKLLADLPGKIPNQAERDFLGEALVCFHNEAFRAAIVMTWNLTFFHLCHYVLKHKLDEFNAEYPIRYAGIHKKAIAPTITKYEDFAADLKESEVIAICKSANIITKEQFKALDRQIDRRNTAAHPSTTVISVLQAEEFIHDLITNVVLKISI